MCPSLKSAVSASWDLSSTDSPQDVDNVSLSPTPREEKRMAEYIAYPL